LGSQIFQTLTGLELPKNAVDLRECGGFVGMLFHNGAQCRDSGRGCGARGHACFSVGTTRDSRDEPVDIGFDASRAEVRDSGQVGTNPGTLQGPAAYNEARTGRVTS
jgi:hypothetical protein